MVTLHVSTWSSQTRRASAYLYHQPKRSYDQDADNEIGWVEISSAMFVVSEEKTIAVCKLNHKMFVN